MFDLILLVIDFILFILSFTYLFLDLGSYKGEKGKNLKGTFIPKRSKYALLFGLLALLLAVINSLFYV